MKWRSIWCFPCGLVWILAACTSESSPDQAARVEQCAAGWTTVAPLSDALGAIPQAILWDKGSLFYFSRSKHGLFSLPDKGGASVLVPGFPDQLPRGIWFEGERILFVPRDDGTGVPKLKSLPRGGGTAVTVATLDVFSKSLGSAMADGPFALSKDALIAGFTTTTNEFGLVHHDRATGAEAESGPGLPSRTNGYVFAHLELANDWMLAVGAELYTFPRRGGMGALVTPFGQTKTGYLAASVSGSMLWQRSLGAESEAPLRVELGLSTMGTAAVPSPIAASLPAGLTVNEAWSDENDGWYLMALETLADGARHATAWFLDRSHQLKRLACDPQAGRYVEFAAVSPQGLFFAASQEDLDYRTDAVFVRRP